MPAARDPRPPLGHLDPRRFLRQHWQKRPCLIPRAFPGFRSFLSPEDLLTLACREEVESRLVLEHGDTPWQLIHGPFEPEDFLNLPAGHWSVLVQELDRHLPEAADLLEYFDFLPRWRVDDLMVSYAPAGGSVGPHLDSYDVFLLQGRGRRRWQINCRPYDAEDFIPGLDLRILKNFRPDQEWVLEPGDMLYLPPGVAHHGVALEPCLTFSIGLRAPAHRQLVEGYLEEMVQSLDPEARYSDPDLRPSPHPGEIDARALAQLRRVIRELPRDPATLDHWLGRHLTASASGLSPEPPAAPVTARALRAGLEAGTGLRRHERARLAFIRRDARATLFADGEAYPLEPELAALAPLIADHRRPPSAGLGPWLANPAALDLLCSLVNSGILVLES